MVFKRIYLSLSYKRYILIKRIFSKVFKPCISLINLLSEIWLPSTIFPGSRELQVTSPTLRRSISSPPILCRLIWYCIFYRHRSSSITCISMFYMLYVFESFCKDKLYHAWLEFDFEVWEILCDEWYCWVRVLACLWKRCFIFL